MIEINKKLTSLKLSGFVKSIEGRNAYALENKLSYIEFLELLLEDEFANRTSNSYRKRFLKSKLNEEKSINSYDFKYQPELDKRLIMDLSSLRFINEKKNIVFMGSPGVGKTHIANAIGLEALKKGYKVIMVESNTLLDKLYAAKGDGTYQSVINEYLQADILIIDEIGFKKINNIDDFFEIISKRYEKGSVIITTNRNFEEWGEIFGDNVLASAIIDRILHHCHVIRITGGSYRVKDLSLNKTLQ